MKRLPLIHSLAVAVLLLTVFTATAQAGADRICVAGYDDGKLICMEEPHKVNVGALGLVRSVDWNFWAPARRVVGFGRLRVSGGCCDEGIKSKGRIKLTKLKVCGKSVWWTQMTIKYGHGYDETYVRNASLATPCD